MDNITILLFILLTAAFVWWFKLAFEENKIVLRDLERQRKDKLLREERVRRLVNKR